MTKLQRVRNIIAGLIMIAFGVIMFFYPDKGILVVAMVLSITFTIKGLNGLLYYFTIARSMVGGKAALYRGLIYLDVGIITSSLIDDAIYMIILYIVILHIFAGLVDIMRAREARLLGSPLWIYKVAYGGTNILIALAVVIGGFTEHSAKFAVWIYAGGLIYSAIVRIVSAFRKTAIVYIK